MKIRTVVQTVFGMCILSALIGCNITIGDGYSFNYKGETAERSMSGESVDVVTQLEVDYRFGDVQIEAAEHMSWDWNVKCWAESKQVASAFAQQVELQHTLEGTVYKFAVQLPEEKSELRGVKSTLVIRVPKNVAVVTTNRHGDVNVTDRTADVMVTNQHGDTELSQIFGTCNVTTQHGALQLAGIHPAAPIASKAEKDGAKTLEVAERPVADQNQPTIKISIQHGDLDVTDVDGLVQIAAQHTDIKGQLAGDLAGGSSHGDVNLVFSGNSIVWAGSHSELSLTVENDQVQSLDLRTQHDDIQLVLPKSLAANVTTKAQFGDVKSAFKSGNGIPIKIVNQHGDIDIRVAR